MNHIFFIKLYSGSILLLNSRIYINIRLKELFEIDFQRERTMLIIHLCIYKCIGRLYIFTIPFHYISISSTQFIYIPEDTIKKISDLFHAYLQVSNTCISIQFEAGERQFVISSTYRTKPTLVESIPWLQVLLMTGRNRQDLTLFLCIVSLLNNV